MTDLQLLLKFKSDMQSIEVPDLKDGECKKMLAHAHGHLAQAILSITINEEEY